MLFKKEHYDLLSNFENQFKHRRLDKEKKDMWHAGVIYQDGHVNELFLAFRRGYAFGVYQSSDAANELAATPAAPSQQPVPFDQWNSSPYTQVLHETIKDLSQKLASMTQSQPVTVTDRQFDLICQAIDKADTITMEDDYMMDSDDCIAVVRVMQALFDIAALREKEGK